MTRPHKRIPCPDCVQGVMLGTIAYARNYDLWEYARKWDVENKAPSMYSQLRALATGTLTPLDCPNPNHTGCVQPKTTVADLLGWLTRHSYTVRCPFCNGRGKVHSYRVVERALVSE